MGRDGELDIVAGLETALGTSRDRQQAKLSFAHNA